jgi:hypothetical protein
MARLELQGQLGGAGKRKAAGGEGGRGYGAAAWSAPYTLDTQLTDNNTLHVRGRLVYTRWICPRGIAVCIHSSDDSERFSEIATRHVAIKTIERA